MTRVTRNLLIVIFLSMLSPAGTAAEGIQHPDSRATSAGSAQQMPAPGLQLAQNTSSTKTQAYMEWLLNHSMLMKADKLAEQWTGNGNQWLFPYALARPDDFLNMSSVWFTLYPASVVGRPGENVLQTMGDPNLLRTLRTIGVDAIHTGPMKRSGSVLAINQYKPTIDGHFDRIELAIDPDFGSQAQYQTMIRAADANGIAIIGDLVPGHTGKGPDFRLAERNVEDFPGLYTMVEIAPEDWSLLPSVPVGQDSINLSQDTAQKLRQQGYLVGPLDTVIFYRAGIKESNWSATDIVIGEDGKQRRWVYLHLFKQGQPSLNWLDPSYGAYRMLSGDALHSLHILGAKGLRLDATIALGTEIRPGKQKAWFLGHPLSAHATTTVAMFIRKYGGYSFQEFNTDFDTFKQSFALGPDLSYDFFTRPTYLHALISGDAGTLRLVLREMLNYGIDPSRLVHALQNHDELMLDMVHLKVQGNKTFAYEGVEALGKALYEQIAEDVITATTGPNGPFNESFAMSPGICSTLAGVITAKLGVHDLDAISTDQKATIRDAHLSAATFNAMQPGVFALSGWDLVGALPVPRESVKDLLQDNDCRWLNRGAYDLMNLGGKFTQSPAGLPLAKALYGSLPEQLQNANSFVSRLKNMLALREKLGIAKGRLVAVPSVNHPGVVVLVHELPRSSDAPGQIQMTAVNFGQSTVAEEIQDQRLQGTSLRALFSSQQGAIDETIPIKTEKIAIALEPLEAKVFIQE